MGVYRLRNLSVKLIAESVLLVVDNLTKLSVKSSAKNWS